MILCGIFYGSVAMKGGGLEGRAVISIVRANLASIPTKNSFPNYNFILFVKGRLVEASQTCI